ncbi:MULTISPECIES: hypothetical protein [Clostridium]|uniref:Uncharacterized protein n=1 Tax=Clostridium faecium TaxID=2762223 RepID=A0ABR8YR89_9CLOT|nr:MULTISPECIES: hypothetical protein [Clostridium]MBD8046770.1 hypothetical protein [Clostridium faecium]
MEKIETYEEMLAKVDMKIRKAVKERDWTSVDILRAERGKLVGAINGIK